MSTAAVPDRFTTPPDENTLAATVVSPELDHRRSQMESPIELVRRFCAAWSDNMGAVEQSWPPLRHPR
jgi:hypothetical protein